MTKAIAKQLNISHRTINWHMRNLCATYKAKNSVHLMHLTHPAGNAALASHPDLTSHQNAILHMIMLGFDMKEIAREKKITSATARLHRENIRDKMGASSMRSAAAIILCMSAPYEA